MSGEGRYLFNKPGIALRDGVTFMTLRVSSSPTSYNEIRLDDDLAHDLCWALLDGMSLHERGVEVTGGFNLRPWLENGDWRKER